MADLLFLGSSAAIQLPSFHCSWSLSSSPKRSQTTSDTRLNHGDRARDRPRRRQPDLEFQLERGAIRQIDRIFLTHWHFDHVWGLAALVEPSRIAEWPRIEVYLPSQVAYHFDQELAHMKERVHIHSIRPGDKFELPDATWEVVKTTHTPHSVGFIIESAQRFAYLVDGVMPAQETLARLKDLDFVVLEATVDELLPKEGERWLNFSLQEAINCWKHIGTGKCILTHMSCHSWKKGKLVAGLSESERLEVQAQNPGLRFAFDGMRLKL